MSSVRCMICAHMINTDAHTEQSARDAHNLFEGDHEPLWWTMGLDPQPFTFPALAGAGVCS